MEVQWKVLRLDKICAISTYCSIVFRVFVLLAKTSCEKYFLSSASI